MNSPEVFYLHIHGEQRGPYTVPQIDHLLNSGLITEETLYWREGLELWQPVTQLVARRRRPKRGWMKPAIALGVVVVLAVFLRVFGPITLVGWREAAQYEFTPSAAYWKARDTVRNQALPPGTLIQFYGMRSARVELQPDETAKVRLRADVVDRRGTTRVRAWDVELSYDARLKEWAGRVAREVSPDP